MQVWALLWHVRTLSDQPIALGGVGLARIVPIIVFSLLGGAVADAANRRRVLFVTQSILALEAVALTWLTLSGQLQLWHIYALTAVQASAAAFDLPARQSLVPNLVPARDLPNAFSLQSIAFQTGSIVGPAASGLVIARLGLAHAYGLNALTYLAVLAALVLMGHVDQEKSGSPRALGPAAIAEGIRFMLGQPIILSTMLLDFFATFFSSANTLMPVFARDVLRVGAVEYGWLSSAQAVGAVLAAVVLSQRETIPRQGPLLLWAVVAYGLATIGFGFARTVPAALIALAGIGAADAVSTIIRNTIRQIVTPDRIRGRMTSVNQIFFTGGPQLGEVEAGVAAQLFGAPLAVVGGGLGCLAAVLWVRRRWPELAAYMGHEVRPAA